MSIFDFTPVGACGNAIRAASQKDRQEATRQQSAAPRTLKRSLILSVAETVRQAVDRAVKTTASVISGANLRSRDL
jgi:hypothetical protein